MFSKSLLFLVFSIFLAAQGFTTPTRSFGARKTPLFSSREEQRTRLAELGYSEEEIENTLSTIEPSEPPKGQQKVYVNEVNVDPVSLTAVGFGLIALNFLVFANMGDGGIAGVIATFINTWDN